MFMFTVYKYCTVYVKSCYDLYIMNIITEAHVLYYTYIQKLSFLDCFMPKQSLNGLKALFYDLVICKVNYVDED